MGYSIAVCPRSDELREKALAFAEKHFRTWPELAGQEEDPFASRLYQGPLAYDDNPKHIGFDYGPSVEGDRTLVWALIAWLAIRVGTQEDGVAQFLYDGGEWISVDPKSYDEDGWFTDEYTAKEPIWLRPWFRQFGKLIKPELERLSRLWEKEES